MHQQAPGTSNTQPGTTGECWREWPEDYRLRRHSFGACTLRKNRIFIAGGYTHLATGNVGPCSSAGDVPSHESACDTLQPMDFVAHRRLCSACTVEIWGDNQIRIIPEMDTARQASSCVVLPDGRPVRGVPPATPQCIRCPAPARHSSSKCVMARTTMLSQQLLLSLRFFRLPRSSACFLMLLSGHLWCGAFDDVILSCRYYRCSCGARGGRRWLGGCLAGRDRWI